MYRLYQLKRVHLRIAVCLVCLALFSVVGWHAAASDSGLMAQFQKIHPKVVIHDRWRFSSWSDTYDRLRRVIVPYGYVLHREGRSPAEQEARGHRLALKLLTRAVAKVKVRQQRRSKLAAARLERAATKVGLLGKTKSADGPRHRLETALDGVRFHERFFEVRGRQLSIFSSAENYGRQDGAKLTVELADYRAETAGQWAATDFSAQGPPLIALEPTEAALARDAGLRSWYLRAVPGEEQRATRAAMTMGEGEGEDGDGQGDGQLVEWLEALQQGIRGDARAAVAAPPVESRQRTSRTPTA